MTSCNPSYHKYTQWGLSLRQIEVLTLLCECYTSEAVAVKLGVSSKTVDAHLDRIRELMGCTTRMEMALKWDRWVRANGFNYQNLYKNQPTQLIAPNVV